MWEFCETATFERYGVKEEPKSQYAYECWLTSASFRLFFMLEASEETRRVISKGTEGLH